MVLTRKEGRKAERRWAGLNITNKNQRICDALKIKIYYSMSASTNNNIYYSQLMKKNLPFHFKRERESKGKKPEQCFKS